MKPLSPKQNMVIYALQQGWELLTNSGSSIIYCCSKKGEFTFSSTIFWNLVRKGLICQEIRPQFEYKITVAGQQIKTKPVELTTTINQS